LTLARIHSATIELSGTTLTIKFDGDINISGKTITLQASTLTLNGSSKGDDGDRGRG